MTRTAVILKAIQGKLTWPQAADICGISARHLRRLRYRYERFGLDGLRDGRGRPRRKQISFATIREICRLKEQVYPNSRSSNFTST